MASLEEPVVPVEAEPVAESNVVTEPTKEKDPPPATKKAVAKEPKKKKVAAPRKRSSPTHPPYFEVSSGFFVDLVGFNNELGSNYLCARR